MGARLLSEICFVREHSASDGIITLLALVLSDGSVTRPVEFCAVSYICLACPAFTGHTSINTVSTVPRFSRDHTFPNATHRVSNNILSVFFSPIDWRTGTLPYCPGGLKRVSVRPSQPGTVHGVFIHVFSYACFHYALVSTEPSEKRLYTVHDETPPGPKLLLYLRVLLHRDRDGRTLDGAGTTAPFATNSEHQWFMPKKNLYAFRKTDTTRRRARDAQNYKRSLADVCMVFRNGKQPKPFQRKSARNERSSWFLVAPLEIGWTSATGKAGVRARRFKRSF